jgi:hypothetical protein
METRECAPRRKRPTEKTNTKRESAPHRKTKNKKFPKKACNQL